MIARTVIHAVALPWTRPPLSLNSRLSWPARARITREIRETTGWLARAARIGPCGRIRVRLTYTPPDRRRRDRLNLAASLKAMVDGLVDAGVIPDDDDSHLIADEIVIAPVDRATAGMVLRIEVAP